MTETASSWKQFWAVFGALFKNNFKKTKGLGEKKAHKIFSIIAIAFGAIVMLAYLAFFTVILTRSAIQFGIHDKVLYLFIALAQFIILFFGAFATMSYIFFSKDNQILAAMPIKASTVFLAKFFMAYVTELFISAIVILPTLTAYGVTCIVSGVKIGASFFILEVLGIFFFPIIPLLIISLISLPLMYIVAFIRKRAIANALATAIVILLVSGLYLGIMGAMAAFSQDINQDGIISISPQVRHTFDILSKVTIFNKPMVDAMLNNKVLINLSIYLTSIIALIFINLAVSSLLYRRGISIIIEGEGSRRRSKHKKPVVYTSSGLESSLIKKELKTLAHTPMMLVNSLSGAILGPLIILFMHKMGSLYMVAEGGKAQIYAIGFISYFTSIMVGATNQVAMVGFSREGKSLAILKSLPMAADVMVKIKVRVATLLNLASITVTAIVYAFLAPERVILSVLGIVVIAISCGYGANCIGLHNDLKNPNLKWNNITELTRNNKKAMKPALTIIGVGLFYMIVGAVIAAVRKISFIWGYLLFIGICLAINSLLIVYGHKKLFNNPQALLDKIEV